MEVLEPSQIVFYVSHGLLLTWFLASLLKPHSIGPLVLWSSFLAPRNFMSHWESGRRNEGTMNLPLAMSVSPL